VTAHDWDGDSIDSRPTIFAHALALSALHGSSPWPDGGHPLPDAPAGERENAFPSVVRDGVTTHHFAPPKVTDDEVREIVDLFLALARSSPPHARDLAVLHESLSSRPAIGLADRLAAGLRARRSSREPVPSTESLRRVARMLVMAGSRRDAVKTGIVVLGTCGDERDRELLVLLGALEELTLFAVVALMATQPDRERAVFDVARRVTNWGRIHAVERLASTTDPEIQAWLLRDGFRNGVMYEYLACIAATAGRLYEALLDPAPDQELITSAGEVLATLSLLGGPAKDMRHYPDAVPAMHRFAELVAEREPTLRLLDSLLSLKRFVTSTPEFNWPDGEPARLSARCAQLLARPAWADVTLAALTSPHGTHDFNQALACARRLDIPVLQHALRHLRDHPANGYAWHMAIKEADAATIDRVAGLASAVLPLDDIASGPALSLGLGPGYQYDHVLESVLPGLAPYPGTGPELVRAALASRVTRVRRAALRVLRQWPGTYRDWVAAAAAAEPDAELRADMDTYLDSAPARDEGMALCGAGRDYPKGSVGPHDMRARTRDAAQRNSPLPEPPGRRASARLSLVTSMPLVKQALAAPH
jgi:hypothetical protein